MALPKKVSSNLSIDGEVAEYRSVPVQSQEDQSGQSFIPETVEDEEVDNRLNSPQESPKKICKTPAGAHEKDIESNHTNKYDWITSLFKDYRLWIVTLLVLSVAYFVPTVLSAVYSYDCKVLITQLSQKFCAMTPNENQSRELKLADEKINALSATLDGAKKTIGALEMEKQRLQEQLETEKNATQSMCFNLSSPRPQIVRCNLVRCKDIPPEEKMNGIESDITSTDWFPKDCTDMIVPNLPSCQTTKGASCRLEIEDNPLCPGRKRFRCSCWGTNEAESHTTYRNAIIANVKTCPKM